MDLLEMREWAETGSLWLTGATPARNGKKRERGSDDSGENADHGKKTKFFKRGKSESRRWLAPDGIVPRLPRWNPGH